MRRILNRYLNEIVSLAMMCLMIVALVHTEVLDARAPTATDSPTHTVVIAKDIGE